MKNKLLLISLFLIPMSFIYSQSYQEVTGLPFTSGFNPEMVFFDMDADGDMDVIITANTQVAAQSTITKLYSNDGSGNFTEIPGPFEGVGQGSTASGDIDGDGDIDLILTGKNQAENTSTKVYLNNGSGTFSIMGNTNLPNVFGGEVRLVDLDSDNDLDLMLGGFQNGTSPFNSITKLYMNNGSGTFTESTTSTFEYINRDIQIFDVDLDGDKDIMISGYLNGGSTATKTYLNDGSAGFTLSTNTIDMVGDIAVIDHNGDNYLDVIVAGHPTSSQSNAVTQLYTNNGTGSFTAVTGNTFPTFTNSAGMVVHDFDGDNDKDVIFIGWGSSPGYEGHGMMFHNNGSGSFSENTNAGFTGGRNANVAMADVDGDNKMDILMMGATVPGTIPFVTLYKEYVCTVNIPDTNLKAALLDHGIGITAFGAALIDTNQNGEIECTEATAYTGSWFLTSEGINDATGLEEFINLSKLYIAGNNLNTIDVSNNTQLVEISIGSNNLNSIDVTNNPLLTNLRFENAGNIPTVDLFQNTQLDFLSASYTGLTSLDLSNNSLITEINLTGNNLGSIDLSNNTMLNRLFLEDTQLNALDLSNNTMLTNINAQDNNLTALDVSQNTALQYVFCQDNQLLSLNVANGNNSNFISFNANNNPNLSCIQVDDVNYSNANWTGIDANHYFSVNCSVAIEELTFSELSISPNPTTGHLYIDTDYEIEQIELFTLDGKKLLETSNTNMNITHMPKGIYILKVRTSEGIAHRKMIKQ